MVLVLLGTQNNSFARLMKEIEKCIENNTIKEEVIAQVGSTNFESDKMIIKKYCSSEELMELINKANFVITHGGAGSIINCIKANKKVIAVPRKKEYKEHVNDHQIQLVEALSDEGFIIGTKGIEELEDKIKLVDNFNPKKFISNTDNMINKIEEYINNN